MSRRLDLVPVSPRGCSICSFLPTCGGLEQQTFYGCFYGCGSCGLEAGRCDYTCPRKPDFWRDWAEVGGIFPEQRRKIPSTPLKLPRYIPMIRHGSMRSRPLVADYVALNTFEVLDSRCRSRFSSATALRRHFMLASETPTLLISVKQDPKVESFWQHRSSTKLGDLAGVGVAVVSTPNFSIFDDAPRLHSVRNLWRILRSAEDIADSGLIPLLHVNAVEREDWRWWAKILRDNPSVRFVVKEFQTGLMDTSRAAEAIDGLQRLQDDLGRPLHPIIVGGRRVVPAVSRRFPAFTLVDSAPFMATVKRHRIVVEQGTARQVESPTCPEEQLDRLLRMNLSAYQNLVDNLSASSAAVWRDDLDE